MYIYIYIYIYIHTYIYIYIYILFIHLYRVTEFSGKAPYREMRGFAGRERQPQSGAPGTADQQLAPWVSLEPIYAAFSDMRISLMIWSSRCL